MWYAGFLRHTHAGSVVRFPDFPDLTAHGADVREATGRAEELLDRHLAGLLTGGVVPPEPSDVSAERDERRLKVSLRPALAVMLQLRWMRQRQGLSLEQVAQRMGVSRQRVAHIESCADNWTLQTLDRMTRALGGELQVLMRPRRRRSVG